MKIYRKLIYEIDGLKFFLQNLNASRYLPIFNTEIGENYTISPCSKDDIENLCSFHKLLRNDRVLNFWRKILYRKRGLKLVAIIKNIENDIIGFEMFYFKKYEAKNGIIHEAFIGIDEKYKNKSLATILRKFSIKHFCNTNLSAISTNISIDNMPSLVSAQKAGFKISSKMSTKKDLYLYYDLTKG